MKLFNHLVIDKFRKVNWMLLLFLIFFMNVKVVVKITAILVLLILNRKMFLEKNIFRKKFIWFYISVIIIAFINLLFNISSISPNYLITFFFGIFFWSMSIGAAFLSSWFILKTDIAKLHTTVTLFFILNAVITLAQLLFIIADAGSVNPYVYQGMYQKYFISTGDLLTGISFDVSSTNALLNAFGLVYFLSRNKMQWALLCMTILLLTASNFTNILIGTVLLFLFIFKSNRNQKSIILVCFFFLAIFMIRISPQNDHYAETIAGKLFNIRNENSKIKKDSILTYHDSLLNNEERKQKIAMLYVDSLKKARVEEWQNKNKMLGILNPVFVRALVEKPIIPKANIHTKPYQRKKDVTDFQRKLLAFAKQNLPDFDTSKQTLARNLPGKLIALQQTILYLKDNPRKIFFGAGMGNFSSKLAYRVTGLGMAGSYSQKFTYINNDFLNNHLNLYLSYFSKDRELHSLINSSNSAYDQLISEYGLAGIAAFVFLYIGFFVRHIRKLTYGIPLLLILIGALGVEYWYEQLSVVIFFELLMLLNIKETSQT